MEAIAKKKRTSNLVTIYNLPEVKNSKVRATISSTLIHMGVKANFKGFGYIVDIVEALNYAVESGEVKKAVFVKLTDLYALIGEANNDSYGAVERNIRHAVEDVFEKGNQTFLKEVFGYSISYATGKVTNKNFLYGLYAYLFEYSKSKGVEE